MKTIRHNTFETNSSSTHSITIVNKKDTPDTTRELIKDGVFCPGNLQHTPAYTRIEYGGSGHVLKASTPAEKIALLYHHLLALSSDSWQLDDFGIEADEVESAWSLVDELTKEHLGVHTIEKLKTYYFNTYAEDRWYLPPILQSGDIAKGIRDHFTDVIMNDDIIILDEETPY